MAITLRQCPLGTGADMREHKRRDGLGRQPRQVSAVPGWDRRGEDAGLWAEEREQRGRSVVAYAEAVAVVWAAGVEAEARVVGLREDRMARGENQVGEEVGRGGGEDLE